MLSRIFARPFVVLASLLLCPAPPLDAALRDQLTTTESRQLQREARLVFELLQNYHYSGRPFLELQNRQLLTGFLNELEPQAEYLLASDREFIFRRFGQTLKSVYLARGDLQPAFEIFELFQERVAQREKWIAERLAGNLEFAAGETFDPTATPQPATSAADADARWKQQLKDEVLQKIAAGRTPADARAEIARRYAEFVRTVNGVDPLMVRERFFDSVIRAYDPHSGYFSADSANEFAVTMGQTLAGVGVQLAKRDGRCVVAGVDLGGPADLHSPLEPGDTIVALADGDGEWREIGTRRLREIVAQIRGRAGTSLRIAYHPAGTNERREVTLTRAEIVSPRDRASGAVVRLRPMGSGERRIGWVQLPAFYAAGLKNDAGASASRDLRELLGAMQTAAKLDGLVLDVRDNPGGALLEAAGVCGLFLPSRTRVMHTRDLGGKTDELLTPDGASPVFTGPLIVLTNTHSASASEVVAGALQFYRRALVVGEASTFGKGTMQNYIELATASRLPKTETATWGTLRLTAQRFYLPDGGAVQRVGVVSDLVLPGPGGKAEPREADLPSALAEDKITPPHASRVATTESLTLLTDDALDRLRERARTDLEQLPEWKLWREEAALRDSLQPAERPLQLAARAAAHARELTQREELRRTRRALAATDALASEAFDLSAIAAANAASDAALRANAPRSFASVVVDTETGRARKLRATAIDFTRFSGDADALAQAFAHGAGCPIDATIVADALRDFTLRPERTPLAWRECFRSRLPVADCSNEALDRGLEALLRALPEIDPELKRERAALDIPLREAVRLAATWADLGDAAAPAASPSPE